MLPPGPGEVRNVAVVGSGIAGLSAAWLLSRQHRVTVYEADTRPGGHANTVVLPGSPEIAVDTGFIVYNDRNYPNLVALFDALGVSTQASSMSFAASLQDGAVEYSSEGLKGLIGQGGNVVRLRFWLMLRDLLRFYREAPHLLTCAGPDLTLGQFLDANRYSDAFVEDHLLPVAAAIWSTKAEEIRAYPALAFVRFFLSHGLLDLTGRPKWRTVTGGSAAYVGRIVAPFRSRLRLGCPVARIERTLAGVAITDANGQRDVFTDVVLATHADRALQLLGDADGPEHDLLGAFRYTDNRAVLHTDDSLMPRRKRVWSSWNFIGGSTPRADQPLCVSYWMNRLQNLETPRPLFVTLNPWRDIAPEQEFARFDYRHPLFDARAMKAQQRLWELQGRRNTWFCGSYFGYGFHEDALQSGLCVAEAIGGVRRPWSIEPEFNRIALPPATMAAAE